jgi:hypothetical protein
LTQAAREKVIAERRQAAAALAEPYKRGHTEKMGDLFVGIQSTIEAIERVIAHEEFIASKQPKSSWPLALGLSART